MLSPQFIERERRVGWYEAMWPGALLVICGIGSKVNLCLDFEFWSLAEDVLWCMNMKSMLIHVNVVTVSSFQLMVLFVSRACRGNLDKEGRELAQPFLCRWIWEGGGEDYGLISQRTKGP